LITTGQRDRGNRERGRGEEDKKANGREKEDEVEIIKQWRKKGWCEGKKET